MMHMSILYVTCVGNACNKHTHEYKRVGFDFWNASNTYTLLIDGNKEGNDTKLIITHSWPHGKN